MSCNLCKDRQYCQICKREEEERKTLQDRSSLVQKDVSTSKPRSRHQAKRPTLQARDILDMAALDNQRVKVRTAKGLFCCRVIGKSLRVIKVLRTKPHKKADEKFSLREELLTEEVAIKQEGPQDDWRKTPMTLTVGEFLDIWSAA